MRPLAMRWLVAVPLLAACSGDPAAPTHPTATAPPPLEPFPTFAPTTQPAPAPALTPVDSTTLARGDGSRADGFLVAGDRAYENGEAAVALKAYESAAFFAPDDPAPVVGIARATLAAEDVPTGVNSAPGNDKALAMVDKLRGAVKLDERYHRTHLELGRTLLVLGDIAAALPVLKRASTLQPLDPEAQSAVGLALIASGHTDDALAPLERAAALDPDVLARHVNYATALLMAGRLHEAIDRFRHASQLHPGDPQVHSSLGAAYLQAGNVVGAMPHLRQAVELEPARAAFHSNLGYAYLLSGEREQAIASFRKALALDPKLVAAWINLGNALAQGGSYDEARAAYLEAKAIDPTDPRVEQVLEELSELEKQAP